jgi:hypothetical protein
MAKTTAVLHDIRLLTAIQPGGGSVNLTLQGGLTAVLAGDHPDYDLIIQEAERSLEWQQPVGIILDAEGRILDLSHTHESLVRRFEEDEDGKRLAIGFWAFCAVCYLVHDHPDFERIVRTLTEAVATGQPVVFANETWPIEGETEIWQKILDVRPVPVPQLKRQGDGAAAVTPREPVPQGATNPEQ